MNKRWKKAIMAAAAAVVWTGGLGYGPQEGRVFAAETSAASVQGSKAASAAAVQKEIRLQSNRALRALADRDFDKLADLAAPSGVRFSPYAYILPTSDRMLTPQQLRQAWTDKNLYVWGSYDGSGEPIKLDFRGYYARFLNDLPYTAPDGVGYNRIVRSGNTPSNLPTVYPTAKFVEFYVKGGRSGSPNTGGMDWGSLRFVWEQIDGEWKLAGIVGDRWTI
ncbi:hypothetical protein [Saccharibacillus qingshengii]|uniref:hypothetical protein n=1 Tax=Saccharibacillus qingshengii TaxID=1763540 RepID=UPI00155310A7|nr:hypothetical protein [Saccharibacillus qingshengii]